MYIYICLGENSSALRPFASPRDDMLGRCLTLKMIKMIKKSTG